MAEQIQVQKTREEHFKDSTFEWVKTDRAGEMCKFAEFIEVGGIEYVCFDDGSRVNISLIGDVVLMHNNSNDILGDLMKVQVPVAATQPSIPVNRNIFSNSVPANSSVDPVVTILNKTKKRSEKMTLSVTVKIPSAEIFNVIRENFDDADDILMNDVIEQISGKMLIESVKRELANIYQKKKKT